MTKERPTPPFGPDSLTGLEFELLAPKGKSRRDLAWALSTSIKGTVEVGFKYISPGTFDNGRPICQLTPAYRVITAERSPYVTLVDDITIRDDLAAPTTPHHVDDPTTTPHHNGSTLPQPAGSTIPQQKLFKLTMDDLRLALWTERRCFTAADDLHQALEPLLSTFDASCDSTRICDPHGHLIGTTAPYPEERERVCELVTAPLRRHDRSCVVHTLLEAATALGFAIPREAALHLHFDAAPWRSTSALVNLIRTYSRDMLTLNRRWSPNPHCRRLGPFPAKVLRVALECPEDLPFDTLATALLMAGAGKDGDLNVKWVASRLPVQPTLEYRALPMSMDPDRILELVEEVENFLLEVWQSSETNRK